MAGRPNYNKVVLANIVEKYLPDGSKKWDNVAAKYMEASGEALIRETTTLKRFWIEKCCNNNKKPSGGKLTDAANDFLQRCQGIHRMVLTNNGSSNAGNEGDSDDEDEDEDDNEDEDDVEGDVEDEDEDEEEDERDDFQASSQANAKANKEAMPRLVRADGVDNLSDVEALKK
jgi:hypothetical protein